MAAALPEWHRIKLGKTGKGRPGLCSVQLRCTVALVAVSCLALWASGVRIHIHVDVERLTPRSSRRELKSARRKAVEVVPSDMARLFSGEPRFDPAAVDPLAQAATFNKSSLTTLGMDPRPFGFSQANEDHFAYNHFFYKMVGGVYLELGGLDGVTFSNTFVFERFAGWKGMLIEPGPSNFAMLRRNRPNAACVNAAVCSEPSTVHFVERHAVGGILEFMNPEHKAAWLKDVDVASLPAISCFPLSMILKSAGVDHINFWSLDVEGAEFEVLRTFDFKAVRVDVLVAEAWPSDANQAKNNKAESILLKSGMKLYASDPHNRWYVRQGFTPSQSPALVKAQQDAAAAQQAAAAV